MLGEGGVGDEGARRLPSSTIDHPTPLTPLAAPLTLLLERVDMSSWAQLTHQDKEAFFSLLDEVLGPLFALRGPRR